MIRYDDVRLVAALARHGSVRRTAEQLGAHLATVYRRLRELEREVGGPLFERSGGRFLPTPLAEEMAAAAGEIDRVLGSLDRRAAPARSGSLSSIRSATVLSRRGSTGTEQRPTIVVRWWASFSPRGARRSSEAWQCGTGFPQVCSFFRPDAR